LHARAREQLAASHAAPADQLDELLMIEQWFRARPGELAYAAPTVVEALQTLTHSGESAEGLTSVTSHWTHANVSYQR